MEKNEKKSLFECTICLGFPTDPVATSCGHVFCWICIKNWLGKGKSVYECPVCKNGIDPEKIISLYSNNTTSSS